MKKSFRCGRLEILKNGDKRPLKITEGGGIRNCPWDSIDMNLHETHEALRRIFGLDEREKRSFLCDYRKEPLDKNQFVTFFQYTQHYGFKFNNTLLYLATPEGPNVPIPRPATTTPTPTVTPPVPPPLPKLPTPKPTRVEADSSTPTIVIKIDDEPTPLPDTTVKRDRPSSSSRYSFNQSLNDLVQYLRNIVKENPREELFLKLLEDICALRGLASIVLDRPKEDIEPSRMIPQTLYNETLEKIATLCRTIKVSIDLNKMKLNQYLTLVEMFSQFDERFKNFHRRSENNPPPAPERPRAKTTPSAATTPKPKAIVTSTSSTTALSPREKNTFFYPLKKTLKDLLEVVVCHGSTSFHYTLTSMIREIQTCTERTNLKEKLYSMEKRLSEKIYKQHCRRQPYPVHRDLQHATDRALDAVRYLIHDAEQLQTDTRRKATRWSTPPPPQPTASHQQTHKIEELEIDDDDDDDLSSEASHSSFGDEVLMEVARTAYDLRPKR